MKLRLITTLLIALFLLNACEYPNKDLALEKEEILVRKIGHEVLRYLGDSIQPLKPVKKIKEHSYQIEFNGPFAFLSDSIINIIDHEMNDQLSTLDYLVKVEDCTTEDVIFSYYISNNNNESVIPCMGRNQEEQCYLLNIAFVPKATIYDWLVLILGAPLVISLIVYGFWQSKKINQGVYEEQLAFNLADDNLTQIGQFGFNFEEQYLLIKENRIELTYKEAKLLHILTQNMSDVVSRENIQQEVWQDDGVMVSRSLDMFISKLRKKLKADSSVEIKSIHGIGYKLIVS